MKISEIVELWDKDAQIQSDNLGRESSDVAILHNKYYKIYMGERVLFKRLDRSHKELCHAKYQYFNGTLTQEELIERGWKPNPLKILKSDLNMYIENDKEVMDSKEKLEVQQEKLIYLESIIKLINNRNFQIKNTLEWLRFTNGS